MKNSNYYFLFLFCLSTMFVGPKLHAQENIDENKLKLEIEPALFFNNGRSLTAMYNVTKDNNLGVGIYFLTTEIPEFVKEDLFVNILDSTNAKVTGEIALNFRYRIKLSDKFESNPYVGLILGWENIRLTRTGQNDLDISTFLVTPHIGYEFYIYKKMVYINPQMRSVFYLGKKMSDETRPESLSDFLILPSISFGLRI